MNGDDKQDDKQTTPVSIGPQVDTLDSIEYYAYNAADRLKYVKEKIEEREKAYFELFLLEQSLDGNPERGEHKQPSLREPNKPMPSVPCQCADCELSRVQGLLRSLTYAIGKLKAVHASLT